MKNILIRRGKKEDIQAVFDLIKELALFEKTPDEVKNTPEMMLTDSFGDKPVFYFLVAEIENEIVGTAIFYISYSTWRGKGVYLDDLVVKENYRGKGIGKAFMDVIFAQAREWSAQIVHWQVLKWNEQAINFYKKINTHIDDKWLNCKLYKDEF